jgi:hypothetical protein
MVGVPEPPRPRQRWIAVLAVVWGLVLAGGAVWAVGHGRPTAREQTTTAAARPTVDRVIAELASVVARDGRSVISISGFERMGDCKVTTFRRGAQYERSLTVLVPAGQEQGLLDRVGAALPAAFHARVYEGQAPRLVADPGDYVAVTGRPESPGEVRFVADTGCRPDAPAAVAPDEPAGATAAAATERTEALLAVLGIRSGAETEVHRVACPGGGSVTTVEAHAGLAGAARPLDEVLREVLRRDAAGAQAVLSSPDLVYYRAGGLSVVAHTFAGEIMVTATTAC